MKYVLEASVAVAALRSSEPSHAVALRRCMPLFAGRDEIVVPAIFELEVTAALTRRGVESKRIAGFLAQHLAQRSRSTSAHERSEARIESCQHAFAPPTRSTSGSLPAKSCPSRKEGQETRC